MKYRYTYVMINGEKRRSGHVCFDDKNKYGKKLPEGFIWVDKWVPNDIDEYGQSKHIIDDSGNPVVKYYMPTAEEVAEKNKKEKIKELSETLPVFMVENNIELEDLLKVKELKIDIL